jgi:hypothetical protein
MTVERAGQQLAEPDYAMQANADLRDRGPRYTETPPDPYAPDAPPVAEPWNAVTAALFVVIAAVWLVRLRGRYRQFPFVTCCLPILLVGGIGGTLFHGLRTHSIYLIMDVAPIQILAVAGSVYLAIRMWRRHGWLYIAGALMVYVGLSSMLFGLVRPQSRQLAISLNYASLATMVLLPVAVVLVKTRFRHGPWMFAGLISFGIAWFFRTWDQYAGPYLPMGSHWLWHTFGAITTALVIEFFYLVEGDRVRAARLPPVGIQPKVVVEQPRPFDA